MASARRTGRIIALTNQKGGVGKTATTVNLGAAMAEAGQRVLLIDLDPQANATAWAGVNGDNSDMTMWDVLNAQIDGKRSPTLREVIVPAAWGGLDIAPTSIDLAAAELKLVMALNRERQVQQALDSVRADYDYILIDNMPSLGLLTINALTAADAVIIPLQTEFLSLKGVGLLFDTIARVRGSLNPSLSILGVVFTMTSRTLHSQDVMAAAQAQMADVHIFGSLVPRSVAIADSSAAAQSILAFDPNGVGAKSYRALAKEVVARDSQR